MSTQKQTEDLLAALHGAVAQGLAERIASGVAVHGDFSNAIKFLKDNNIEAILKSGDQLDVLQQTLAGADLPSVDELADMGNVEQLFGGE